MTDPALVQADEDLRSAIAEHAKAYSMAPYDALLGDYAVIAQWQRIEDDGSSPYTVAYHRQNVPHHIAEGLFKVGAAIAESAWQQEDDD